MQSDDGPFFTETLKDRVDSESLMCGLDYKVDVTWKEGRRLGEAYERLLDATLQVGEAIEATSDVVTFNNTALTGKVKVVQAGVDALAVVVDRHAVESKARNFAVHQRIDRIKSDAKRERDEDTVRHIKLLRRVQKLESLLINKGVLEEDEF